jgi:hypothetical protein
MLYKPSKEKFIIPGPVDLLDNGKRVDWHWINRSAAGQIHSSETIGSMDYCCVLVIEVGSKHGNCKVFEAFSL